MNRLFEIELLVRAGIEAVDRWGITPDTHTVHTAGTVALGGIELEQFSWQHYLVWMGYCEDSNTLILKYDG